MPPGALVVCLFRSMVELREARCKEQFKSSGLMPRAFCHGAISESAWESNPPAELVTPPNRFEDGDQHRPTPALAAHPTGSAVLRQAPARRGS